MENNNEKSSKQKNYIQSTLNFSVLFINSFSKKSKNKVIDNSRKITFDQPQQTTLNFPLINKKRSFSEINTDLDNDNDTDQSTDNESDHDNLDECSNDKYNELPLDRKPYMCPKKIELRRYKYFSRLINPKYVRCICGKENKRYSLKNLKM